MDSKSFTYYSHNSMKDELVNLTEGQLNELRAFYVERFVDNMETKDLVSYVMDDMMRYMAVSYTHLTLPTIAIV